MMKTVLLLVACLALASASRLPEGFPSGLKEQSNPYCTYSLKQVCSTLNATCDSGFTGTNEYTTYYCPSGTYARTESSTCYCRAYTYTAPTLGATCNVGETAGNSYQCRTKNSLYAGTDTTQTYWFSDKVEGDTCTSAFDCSGALQCVSGKCATFLATGALCYNSTYPWSGYSGYCGVKDFCRAGDNGQSYCTARLASGGDCSATADRSGCPSYQACLGADHVTTTGSSGMTCQTPMYYVLAGGVWANYSTQCQTASWTNSTDKTCLSYADQMAIYNYKKIADCSTDSDCSEYGSCDCVGSSSTATTCSFAASTNAELVAAWDTAIAKAKLFYDAGCSWYTYKPASASYPYAGYVATTGAKAGANNVAYCSVKLGYYASTYTACGAFHNMGMSSITIVLSALIATLLAKW